MQEKIPAGVFFSRSPACIPGRKCIVDAADFPGTPSNSRSLTYPLRRYDPQEYLPMYSS